MDYDNEISYIKRKQADHTTELHGTPGNRSLGLVSRVEKNEDHIKEIYKSLDRSAQIYKLIYRTAIVFVVGGVLGAIAKHLHWM